MGKTNLGMNFGLSIASDDGVALGNATVQRHGRVLMLNLDGSRRGSYDRFDTMTRGGKDAPERFDILHGDFPEVGDGALDLLHEYVEEHPDTELVIVDTLQHLRPTSDGRRNVYHEDYDFVHPISEFGRETDTSVLLIHHLNKLDNGDELDKVSGSTGLTGAVENVMILDKDRGQSTATLAVRPREDREEDFDLHFDGHVLSWIVGGDDYTPASHARRQIWNYLCDALSTDGDNRLELQQIGVGVGKETDNVAKLIGKMIDNGAPIQRPERGVYEVVSGAS
jgi:RecA-family ATPase